MEPRQRHGSRQFQYSSIPTSIHKSSKPASATTSTTTPTTTASSSSAANHNDDKTHRRQRSEPTAAASSGSTKLSTQSSRIPSPPSSSSSITTNNNGSNPRSNPSSKPSSVPRSHHDTNQSRRTEKSSSTTNNSSSVTPPQSSQCADTESARSAQTTSKSGDRSRRNDNSSIADKSKKTSTPSPQPGSRGERLHSESRSRNHKDERNSNRKSDTSKDNRDGNPKAPSSKSSSSNSKRTIRPDEQEVSDSKSKDSNRKGKPSHTPKIKRRPRASSSSRQSSSDDGGGRRRENSSCQLGETSRETSTSSSYNDSSVSSRLLPEPPTSSSSSSMSRKSQREDKVTPTDGDRRVDYSCVRDDSDVRSVKSDKSSRSKRAVSAPREIRSASERDRNDSEERKGRKKGSLSYHQIPKSISSSMQTSSSRKHKSLLDVSERQESNEEQISLQELNGPQSDSNRYRNPRYYQSQKSSTSVHNSSDPSKPYSRSDRDAFSFSSKSPKSFHRKQNSNTSDVVMTSDSERSTRGPSVSSAEEPLLPKGHTTTRQNSDPRSNRRSLPTPNIQTFPRMKTQNDSPKKSSQMYPVSTATVDRHQTGKTQFLLDRIRNFSSNQIPSQEPYFSPLHRIPSQSSLSSDNRSEVCLDLPDMQEDTEDFYNTGLKADVNIKSRFPIAVYEPIRPMVQPSVCKILVINFFKFFISFILVWPLLVVVLVLVPLIFLVKRFFSWCCCCGKSLWERCCVCICHTHLSSSEAIWLGRGGSRSRSNPVVQSLVVIQRGLDTERIRHLIDSRILFVENRRGRKLYPRFTQKIVKYCCGQAWVSDRAFVTSNHVFNMPGYIETLDDLQQFISKIASEPLSMSHPLWEIQVLHNFREPRDTVLLFRMHMSMTDGVSMVHVLQNALADSTKPSSNMTTFSDEAANTSPFKVMLSGPLTFLSRYVFRRDDFNLLHGGHFETSGESVVAWSEPFSLSAALRVKQVARCTLTDLLLSIISGNIRTYLQVCGIRHPYDVTCAVPVDFQSMDVGALDMENKYTLVHVPLPTNTEGAIPRLWAVKHIMEDFKGSAEAAIVSGARWLTHSILPVSCFQRIWRKLYSRASILLSNLAGPTSVLKLDSREIKCMMYWLPPLDRVAVTVSFFTYADQIRMAVISDRSALPNPELLTRDFIYKLETLSKLLAHRRIPGESSYSSRRENVHLLSSFTLDDLTADQIQLEMSLVQQELHDLKIQLDSGPSDHISHNDHQLMDRIEALKERSSELMMHLRKRKAEEAESAVILSEEGDDPALEHLDSQSRPFRRRTLSMSSRLSTTSVTSTARPLSTASTSNLMTSNHPSPTHHSLPSWPENDLGMEESNEDPSTMRRPQTLHRFPHRPDPELDSPEHQAYRSTSQHLIHSTTSPYSDNHPTSSRHHHHTTHAPTNPYNSSGSPNS